MTTKFEIGKTYSTRSICDHDCVVNVTIASRTAKFVTTTKGQRLGVRVVDDAEAIMPWGRYSMAPIVTAND